MSSRNVVGLGLCAGSSDGTFKQRNLRTPEVSKDPKNFQTQKCWLCQCIRQLQERGSLVAHRALVWRFPADSLGLSKFSFWAQSTWCPCGSTLKSGYCLHFSTSANEMSMPSEPRQDPPLLGSGWAAGGAWDPGAQGCSPRIRWRGA